ncbi:hypothetical protein OIU76_007275 [Salix suchowensis]|nr:hypothetical protein OIU76_007275 [Salix suchowensis]
MEEPQEHNDEEPPKSSTTPVSPTCTSPTCATCASSTPFDPPPTQSPWSEISPPPTYRPLRAPAINLPPNTNSQAIILAPVPRSQKVLPISLPHTFQSPSKRIHSPDDIRQFISSDSATNFLGFIVSLSESIRSHKLSDSYHESTTLKKIVSIIETLIQWTEEIPPAQQSSRYGNISYRTWHNRLVENSESLMLLILPEHLKSSIVEIVPYFTDSFGNSSRIDYGTGHETNFAAWLYCLARMGIVEEVDYQALVSRVFVNYIELMRKLQSVYNLEPAGSHGVWGLDDYHFLPFIFGSSQLIDHKYMKPKSIHNEDILVNFSSEYMYLSGIVFIKKVKKGLFAEHSPLLDDISGVPTWNKVNSGLLKMYRAEVLEKVPIMQHFLFGSLIQWYGFLFLFHD